MRRRRTAGSSIARRKPDDPFPTEYDFAKAPKLKVPGDWNTQRESLLFYEGPVWYEKDFTYQPKPHTRILFTWVRRIIAPGSGSTGQSV